jgi:DNA-binding beta-propeller fold protein YncE
LVLRALTPGVLALALTATGASAHRSGGAEEAYVALEDEDVVAAVSLDTGVVSARIRVPDGPHNVTVTGDGRFVLVTSPPAGRVTLIDGFRHRVVKTFAGFGYPHDVEVEGRYAYVTDEERGHLVQLDVRARRVVGRFDVGPRPHDVAVGDVALVTHGSAHPALTVVEVSGPRRGEVLGELAAGGPAHDISEQPDSATAFVTYWGSGAVGAVDWGRGRVLWKRSVGDLVHHVQFDHVHGRRLWVTDHRTGDVLALSSWTGRVLRRLRGCPGAHHVHFGPGRGRVVAACHDSGTILVFDPVSGTKTAIAVGAGPHGIAIAFVP